MGNYLRWDDIHTTQIKDLDETAEVGRVDLNQYRDTIRALIDAYQKEEKVGSITEQEISQLWNRLQMEEYCIRTQTPYEELQPEDYEAKYLQDVSDNNDDFEPEE